MFKAYNGISPRILRNGFPLKESALYWSNFPFKTRNVKTVTYGTETLGHLGPKIWSMLPKDIKCAGNLKDFKNKIKLWRPAGCPCSLCRTYVAGVGFVNIGN